MEERIELRKKEFKKTFDDPRRRREETQIQIRKQHRDERLTKKRQQALDELGSSLQPGVIVDLASIPMLAQRLMSNDPQEQFHSSQEFRKLLSIERSPPIQEVIDAGVVPRLIEFLRNDSRQDLQFESAWALTNIASGTQDQTKIVIDNGAIPIFVQLLSSSKDEVREQAIWALGNISGDCSQFRDLVIHHGGLNPLLLQLGYALQSHSKLTLLRNSTWTLSNLFRGKPRPSINLVLPAIPLLRELIFSTDLEVLTDACWAISYISEANDKESDEAIDIIIRSGICQRIVQLLGHNSFTVVTAALRTVGNIVSGSEAQTQTMVVAGCLPALRSLLQSSRKVIRKEACWSISNIAAGTREQIEDIIHEGIFPCLVQVANTNDDEVKREANWVFANALSGGNSQQIQYIVGCGVFQPLCEVLEWEDERLVGVALDAIDAVLRIGEEIRENQGLESNPYTRLLEESDGFTKLEDLKLAPVGSKAYRMAMNITSRYLEINDDDDYHSSTDDQMVINPNRLFNSQFDFSNSQQHSNDVMQG